MGKKGDSLITEARYEPNIHSDSQFMNEDLSSRDAAAPVTMIADGAYGGEKNIKLAKEKNVNLVTTALTGVAPDPHFAGFQISESDEAIKCPNGIKAEKFSYYPGTEIYRAQFPLSECQSCPYRDRCHGTEQKKTYVINVSYKKINRAKYYNDLKTDEYKELTRKRNAIEGIPSVMRRRYNVDKIPVHGLIRTRHFFIFKVIAYNSVKLSRYLKRQRVESAQNSILAE